MSKTVAFTFTTYDQADWGLLEPIVTALQGHPNLFVDFYCLGDSARASNLIELVEDKGWESTVLEFPKYIDFIAERCPPDHVVILGDRYVDLRAALEISWRFTGAQIHHLYAGDCSGGLDDRYRHALSLLAHHLYAFSTESAKVAVSLLTAACNWTTTCRQVSYPPEFNKPDESLEGFEGWLRPYALVRLHPNTAKDEPYEEYVQDIYTQAEEMGLDLIVMNPNGEPGSDRILKAWRAFAGSFKRLVIYYPNTIPREIYLRVLREADWIAGNSSSFVHDIGPAGADSKRVTLYGDRQYGRVAMEPGHESVISALLESFFATDKPTDA